MRSVWRPSCAPKCARCFRICHILLLPHLDLSSGCIIPSGPLGEFNTSFESFQQELSNEPRRKQRGALDAPLRAGFPFYAFSSSFCLLLGLFSTSLDTEYISGIFSTIRFDWCRSQVSKCTRCLGTHHVLLLPHFNLLLRCWAPWDPFGAISTFPESSLLELSNDPRRDPKDALVVPLRAELWCCALSCSFCLWFRICSAPWADLGQFLLRNIQYIYNTKFNICIMSWLWQHHWQSHSGITQSTQVTKIKPRDQLPLWVSERYLNWSRAKVYFPDVVPSP